jgi:endonuclease/exonuclease/phosphatase family metal-dependent hydrolase
VKLRIATLNMEQDHKRWALRRELIIDELAAIDPDVFAMNEVCVPLQTARWIQRTMRERHGRDYALVQQTKVGGTSQDGEALLTRFPIVETGNLDYRTRDIVAMVARLRVGERLMDVYVTHLYMTSGDDSLRLFQVQQLLAWVGSRDDVNLRVACGDFNARLEEPSAALMAKHFRPTQTAPTAFTALAGEQGEVSHPQSSRMDRCIDYIWLDGPLEVLASKVCFDRPSASDATLYPSDHAGVWADLAIK